MSTQFRFINLIPNVHTLHLYINNTPLLSHVSFKHVSPYISLPPASYQLSAISIIHNLSITTTVNLLPNKSYTVIVYDNAPDVKMYGLEDHKPTSCLKAINLSPHTLDIHFAPNNSSTYEILFSNLLPNKALSGPCPELLGHLLVTPHESLVPYKNPEEWLGKQATTFIIYNAKDMELLQIVDGPTIHLTSSLSPMETIADNPEHY